MLAQWALVRSLRAWWRQLMNRPAFFPNRAVLDRESPLADKLDDCAVVYAMFMTGLKVIQEISDLEKLERLLLPDPGSKSLAYYQAAMTETKDLARDVRETTRLAIERGIKIRWVTEFPGFTFIIGNPKGRDAWAQIEIAIPVIHGSNHPSFEFRKPRQEATVDDIIKAFNTIWESDSLSREPKNSELEDG